jgi:hypothetical protein
MLPMAIRISKCPLLMLGWLGLLAALAGCSEVAQSPEAAPPLSLLYLYPHLGETGVPTDARVIAVFSHEVFSSDGAVQAELTLTAETFTLERWPESGSPIRVTGTTVAASQVAGQPRNNTAILTPAAPLDPGARYRVVLAASVVGTDPAGHKLTTALGAQVESSFVTAE